MSEGVPVEVPEEQADPEDVRRPVEPVFRTVQRTVDPEEDGVDGGVNGLKVDGPLPFCRSLPSQSVFHPTSSFPSG